MLKYGHFFSNVKVQESIFVLFKGEGYVIHQQAWRNYDFNPLSTHATVIMTSFDQLLI